MKDTVKMHCTSVLFIIALAAVMGFSMAACGDGGGPSDMDSDSGGYAPGTKKGDPDSYIPGTGGDTPGTNDVPVTPSALSGTVSISGYAEVGQTLTANTDFLGGSGTISYQWKRNGETVIGTDSSYTVQSDDVGHTITVTVTRSGYSGSVTSAPTTAVPDPSLPALTGTVTISGTADVGQTLTAITSSLGGSGTISYQWKRFLNTDTSVDIGTNSNTYTVQYEDAQCTIAVTVTRSGNSGHITSAPTASVPEGLAFYLLTGGMAYTVSKGASTAAEVVIPAVYNGLPVTRIAGQGFQEYVSMTSITIPDSVTSIDGAAFGYCTGLTNVTIGNNVTSIGASAFEGCENLTSITIPNSVTSIGAQAFAGCGLTSVTIPDNVTSISNRVFAGCGLTSITIPDSVTSIGEEAFSYCTSLTSVTIGNNVTSISRRAFYECTGLTAINFNATSMDELNNDISVFYRAGLDADGITLTIGANVTRIPAYLFHGVIQQTRNCHNITTLNFAAGSVCQTIGEQAFSNCINLTSITIPNNMTSIGARAFASCSRLTTINFNATAMTDLTSGTFDNSGLFDGIGITLTIGANVTRIPANLLNTSDSYSYTTKVTTINFAAGSVCQTIGDYAFQHCTGLTSVTIPNSVKSIGESAFSYCTSLTSVTIGNNVSSIGLNAFFYAGLTSVTIPASVTSIAGYAFYNGDLNGMTSVIFEGTILSSGFVRSAFYGDLYDVFYSSNSTYGTPGTYRRTTNSSTWYKQ